MFTGLVEETSPVLQAELKGEIMGLSLKRPSSFQNLKEGESVSIDGLCLTLESFNEEKINFSLGPETLKITGWTLDKLKGKTVNLERSLTLQSAVGGHFLTGHVDGLALVKKIKKQAESLRVQIQMPKGFKKFFWKKGYIALNGVSLTINKTKGRILEIGLIPQTLKRTNLSAVKEGDLLNFEADYISRALAHNNKGLELLFLSLILLFQAFSLFLLWLFLSLA